MKKVSFVVLVVLLVSGCMTKFNGNGQRRFTHADDLQLHGRDYSEQTVELAGCLGFVKGMYLLDIGGDVLLLPSEQLKPVFEQYVGKVVIVTGLLERPRNRPPEPVLDSNGVNIAQGWGGYTLFEVRVDSIR